MTKEVPLSRSALVALVDDDDYARVMAAGPWHINTRGRTTYAQRNTRRPDGRNTTQSLHTFLTGWPIVDHADGNGLNNQRANLRQATDAQNAANRQRRKDSTVPFKGVHRNKGRGLPWRAQIGANYKKRHLGLFSTPEEAARAYDRAARETWGEFARLNFPEEKAS